MIQTLYGQEKSTILSGCSSRCPAVLPDTSGSISSGGSCDPPIPSCPVSVERGGSRPKLFHPGSKLKCNRVLLELCNSSRSRSGMQSKHAAGCELVRVPGFHHLHSDHGIKFAKARVLQGHKVNFTHMWLAFPHLSPDLFL